MFLWGLETDLVFRHRGQHRVCGHRPRARGGLGHEGPFEGWVPDPVHPGLGAAGWACPKMRWAVGPGAAGWACPSGRAEEQFELKPPIGPQAELPGVRARVLARAGASMAG